MGGERGLLIPRPLISTVLLASLIVVIAVAVGGCAGTPPSRVDAAPPVTPDRTDRSPGHAGAPTDATDAADAESATGAAEAAGAADAEAGGADRRRDDQTAGGARVSDASGQGPVATAAAVPAWEPPDLEIPLRPTAEQAARIRHYYALRGREAVAAVQIAGDGTLVDSGGAEYVTEALQAAGITVAAFVPAAESRARTLLTVVLRGEADRSARNHYGRVHLRLSLWSGPGQRIRRAVAVTGPWRLSPVSGTDAVLRSLLALDPAVLPAALDALESWQTTAAVRGVPYRVSVAAVPAAAVESDAPATQEALVEPDAPATQEVPAELDAPATPPADHAAILTVLRSLGRETRDDTWYLFDIPPAVAERLSGVLDGSPYEATVDSLHGTVRIEYNGAP